MRQYYVLKVGTGFEYEVVRTLEKIIEINKISDWVFNPTVPEQKQIKIVRGKKKEVKKKLYPGYVLIEMDISDDAESPNYWKKIAKIVLSCPYVVSFVGVRRIEKPIPLKRHEVNSYLANIGVIKESQKAEFDTEFSKDQEVKIIDGAFKNFKGVIKEIDIEKEKVIVDVDIFGRKTPVELSFYQIEKA